MSSNGLIKIEVDDARVREMLTKLQAKMADMTPVMATIAEYLVTSIQENFESGGRYSTPGSWIGGPNRWVKLSPVTIARREKKGYWPGNILMQRGRLAASIHRRATKDSAEVGTNTRYATTMHFGAKKGEFGSKTFIQKVKEHIRKTKAGKVIKVRAHQRSVTLKLPWGDIPARPFMVAQDQDIEDITDLIHQYLSS